MKISVIIPAYNHERYVTEAVHSVLGQSCQDFEMIIINDGSTDSTEQSILAVHDPRIRYVSQENSGAHSAINRGISMARGEYVSILNSDDIYLPNRLETCLNFLESHADYSVVMSTVEGIYSDGTPVKKRVTPEMQSWLDWYANALPYFDGDQFYPNAFAKNILITTSNLFARRTCFQECGGFKGLRYAHDWDMLLRLSRRYRIHLVKEDLLQYRMHSENTVHEKDSDLRVQFEVNWLVVENLKESIADVPFRDILELLKNNHDLSFEPIFFLSMMKDRPTFDALIDFNHPQTIQLLQLLQRGISIAGSFALKAQVQELQAWVQELQAQVQDLQTGCAWLASQRDAWKKATDEREQVIASLQAHVQDLNTGQAWLTSQCEAWQKATDERKQVIASLQAHVQDLSTGQVWLTSQCEAWKKASDEQGLAVADLSSHLQDTTERLKKVQSHIGVRLVNRLTGRKLF